MNDYIVPVYSVYIACAVGLTVWLARTLFRNGAIFLGDVFDDKRELATAVNRLLVTGFFMVNLGYALLLVRQGGAETAADAFQLLVTKLGVLLVSLAIVHFVNVAVFWKLRQRRQQRELPPPIVPQRWVAPPPAGPADRRHLPPPPSPAPAMAGAWGAGGTSDYPDPEPWGGEPQPGGQ